MWGRGPKLSLADRAAGLYKQKGKELGLMKLLFSFLVLCVAVVGSKAEAANEETKKRLRAQCELGTDDGLSCWEMGNISFERGDWKSAQHFFGKACLHRWYSGCHNAGVAAQRSGDLAAAKQFWQRACTHNHLASCSVLAFMLWREKDVEHARNLAQKACAEYGEACYLRATITASSRNPGGANKEQALDYFKKGCLKEYLLACYKGGQLSQELRHSNQEAIELYKKSCELAHARSCIDLSEIYVFEGRMSEARTILRDTCQFYSKGEACVALGKMEEKAGNLDAAVRAYRTACRVPYTPACYAWGQLEISRGNTARAHRLFKEACEAGYQKACRALTEKKKPKAASWQSVPRR